MVDDWWPLSGQEGEEKEGLLHLILSLQVPHLTYTTLLPQSLPPGTTARPPPGGLAPSLTGITPPTLGPYCHTQIG